MRIADLSPEDDTWMAEAAELLFVSFRERTPAWPTLESASHEVLDMLQPGKVNLVAIDGKDRVVGWIGGQPQYDGHVWELHPLVVAAAHRRKGIGAALVNALEKAVAERGALTLWLGSDDEIFETSLGGTDIYADVPGALRSFTSRGEHPYPFYSSMGFRLVGVMPDANGRGKPDIYMAKRVERGEKG